MTTQQETADQASPINLQTIEMNSLFLKKKVMESSKIITLYSQTKLELEETTRKLRDCSSNTSQLHDMIEKLQVQQQPATDKLQLKDDQIAKLTKQYKEVSVKYESQRTYMDQLLAELTQMNTAAQKSSMQTQELLDIKANVVIMERNLSTSKTKINQLKTTNTILENRNRAYSSLLEEIIPYIKKSKDMEFKWVHNIEKLLGKKLSELPTYKETIPTSVTNITSPIIDIPYEKHVEEEQEEEGMEEEEEESSDSELPAPMDVSSSLLDLDVDVSPTIVYEPEWREKATNSVEREPEPLDERCNGLKKTVESILPQSTTPKSTAVIAVTPFVVKENRIRSRPSDTPIHNSISPPAKRAKHSHSMSNPMIIKPIMDRTPKKPSLPPTLHIPSTATPPTSIHLPSPSPETLKILHEAPVVLPLPPIPVQSYPINQLLSSIHIYQSYLPSFDKWPFELESDFVVRRLKILFSDLDKLPFPIDISKKQKLFLGLLGDVTKVKNIGLPEKVAALCSGIIESYHIVHKQLICSRHFTLFMDRMQEPLQAKRNLKETKISLVNDLVWNLSLFHSTTPFLDTLFSHMSHNIMHSQAKAGSIADKQNILLCVRFIELARSTPFVSKIRGLLLHFLLRKDDPVSILRVMQIHFPALFQPKLTSLLSKTIFYYIQSYEDNANNQMIINMKAELMKGGTEGERDFLLHENLLGYLVDQGIELVQSLNFQMENHESVLFDVGKSFILLSKRKGWKWTYNVLLCKKLGSFIRPTSGDAILGAVIYLWGELCKFSLSHAKQQPLRGLQGLRARLTSLLSPGSPCSFYIQQRAAQALLSLSVGYKCYVEDVVAWVKKLSAEERKEISLFSIAWIELS